MGNLTRALKENERLKNQNTGLLEALKRKNGQLEGYKEDSAKALREISEMVSAYIGAICLQNEDMVVKISHDEIKRAVGEFDLLIEADETGFSFRLVGKAKET